MNEFVDYLKNCVATLKFEEALSKINFLFTQVDPTLETDLILVKANREKIEKQHIIGIITDDVYRSESTKIANSILYFISEIQKKIYDYLPFIRGKNLIKDTNALEKDIVLFVGANPAQFHHIDIRKEVQEISSKLNTSKKRSSLEFKMILDAQVGDFNRSILHLDREPRFFHFGGYCYYNHPTYGSGLVLCGNTPNEFKMITGEILGSTFKRFKDIECVFLNACYTYAFGIEISKNIPYVIGMDTWVTDGFAIDFAANFYEAIGAGQDVPFAFNYSIDQLKAEGKYRDEQINTPKLLIKGNEYKFEWDGLTYTDWAEKVNPF